MLSQLKEQMRKKTVSLSVRCRICDTGETDNKLLTQKNQENDKSTVKKLPNFPP